MAPDRCRRGLGRDGGRALSLCHLPRPAFAQCPAYVVLSWLHHLVRAHIYARTAEPGTGDRRGSSGTLSGFDRSHVTVGVLYVVCRLAMTAFARARIFWWTPFIHGMSFGRNCFGTLARVVYFAA